MRNLITISVLFVLVLVTAGVVMVESVLDCADDCYSLINDGVLTVTDNGVEDKMGVLILFTSLFIAIVLVFAIAILNRLLIWKRPSVTVVDDLANRVEVLEKLAGIDRSDEECQEEAADEAEAYYGPMDEEVIPSSGEAGDVDD